MALTYFGHDVRVKRAKWLLIGLGLLSLGGLAWGGWQIWPFLLDQTQASAASALGDMVGALAGFLSAFAGAIAAYAAWRAARESSATARQAAEALGLAMEPSLTAYFQNVSNGDDDFYAVYVENMSRWVAADIDVEVHWWGGQTARHRFERIEAASQPNPTIRAAPGSVYFRVPEPVRTSPLDDPDWRGYLEWIDRIHLTYSDERRLLRWKKTCTFKSDFSHDGRYSSSGGMSYDEEVTRMR